MIRRAYLVTCLVLPGFLTGCSLFRHENKPSVEVEAPVVPDRETPDSGMKVGSTGQKEGGATTRPATPAAKPKAKTVTPSAPIGVPVDSIAAPPDMPEHRPMVSAVLTAEQRSTLEAQYRTDVERANQAFHILEGRALTVAQCEQRTSAGRFLAESQAAFDSGDLPRAASLVGKARVIAEELKSGTTPN
ncbi:MAG: hypothetical protein SGI90_16515 [Candidatus Eisenbacteria bacterium]|nr:hypothetical protein [Candidatus Eisenbacteria bacterium]